MSGTFVSANVNGNTITVSQDGQPNSTLDVDASATISRNGKKCTLGDLKAGDSLSYSGDPIVSLSASTKS